MKEDYKDYFDQYCFEAYNEIDDCNYYYDVELVEEQAWDDIMAEELAWYNHARMMGWE